jgi:hypothetical protein
LRAREAALRLARFSFLRRTWLFGAGACGYMHGFSKVISLSQLSPIHTYSRCTSRAAAEHPQMLVDSARAHFRAYESEPFAVRPPRFAARPLRSVAEHGPSPSSLFLQKGLVVPRAPQFSILMARMSRDSSAASISNCTSEIAAFKLASTNHPCPPHPAAAN